MADRYVAGSSRPDWRVEPASFPGNMTLTGQLLLNGVTTTHPLSLVAAFAEDGITMVPATDFLPEVLVKHGVLSRRRLSRKETKDIEFGWQMARAALAAKAKLDELVNGPRSEVIAAARANVRQWEARQKLAQVT